MLRQTLCWALVSSLLLVSSVALAADATNDTGAPGKAPSLAIGAQAPDVTFKDIRYASHTLKDLGEKKAYVVVFNSLDCPVAKRYMPRIVELEKEYRNRDVQFVVPWTCRRRTRWSKSPIRRFSSMRHFHSARTSMAWSLRPWV